MFVSGNAGKDGKDHRGWFVGHFMPEGPACRKDIELKLSFHPQGDGDDVFDAQGHATSFSMLISGRMEYQFRRGDQLETVLVSEPGDYVMWESGVSHTWLALEDTESFTVRWPSVPNDIIKEE